MRINLRDAIPMCIVFQGSVCGPPKCLFLVWFACVFGYSSPTQWLQPLHRTKQNGDIANGKYQKLSSFICFFPSFCLCLFVYLFLCLRVIDVSIHVNILTNILTNIFRIPTVISNHNEKRESFFIFTLNKANLECHFRK